MNYKQLNFEQRCKLSAFWKAGNSQKEIALEVGVDPATISRELKRNIRWNGHYSPEQADCFYKDRRSKSRKPKTFTLEVQNIVKEKIQLDRGSEQISGYGKRHNLFSISHERIYQYILADKISGGNSLTGKPLV